MAWERRKRGGLYYTRSKRVRGRVVREYLGCSEGACILAAFDEADREERMAARAREQQDRTAARAVRATLGELSAATEAGVAEVLEAEGYHRHRGQLRKKRKDMRALQVLPPPGTPPEVIGTLRAGCASEDGSREKVSALFAREPEWIKRIPTLAASAENAILAQATHQVLAEEAWRAQVEDMRTSLSRAGDGALERLLIERVVLTWLAVTVADLRRAVRWQEELSTSSAEFWDRRLSRLNGDFLRASKTLATVRRLRLPAVQVNVGAQQVNHLHASAES